MKIYISKINESWIIDRIKKEWIINNKSLISKHPYFSDIIWIIAPWGIDEKFLLKYYNKKIVYSLYHFEDTSEKSKEIKKIIEIDKYINFYHVISLDTKKILSKYTKKPIYFLPLWVNQSIWFYIDKKDELRKKYGFNNDDYIIGSFQRDTEGFDLRSPKLVKGPDIFIKLVNQVYKENKNLKVLLTGKRRQYVISELEYLKIPFAYYEMTNFNMMNELYNLLDLYLITSRVEGGPQALVECGQTKTPIISTRVGLSEQILHPQSLYDFNNLSTFNKAKPNIKHAYEKSSLYTIPNGMSGYLNMFTELYES